MGKIKLSPERVAELKASQRTLHDLLAEYDKLEECGEDCSVYRAQHEQTAKQIEALLTHYA